MASRWLRFIFQLPAISGIRPTRLFELVLGTLMPPGQ